MEIEKEINVGSVVKTTQQKWRVIEVFLAANADLVFVKKVPAGIRLKIREEKGDLSDEERGN
jgi:hypothetical protein